MSGLSVTFRGWPRNRRNRRSARRLRPGTGICPGFTLNGASADRHEDRKNSIVARPPLSPRGLKRSTISRMTRSQDPFAPAPRVPPKRRTIRPSVMVLLPLLTLAACDSGVLWEDGEYAVIWIDTGGNRSLHRRQEDGDLGGEARVAGDISRVGSNDRMVIVELTRGAPCSLYVIDKRADRDHAERYIGPSDVRSGPFCSIAAVIRATGEPSAGDIEMERI